MTSRQSRQKKPKGARLWTPPEGQYLLSRVKDRLQLKHPNWNAEIGARHGGLFSLMPQWSQTPAISPSGAMVRGKPLMPDLDSHQFFSGTPGAIAESEPDWPQFSGMPVWLEPAADGVNPARFAPRREFVLDQSQTLVNSETVLLPFSVEGAYGIWRQTWCFGPSAQDLLCNVAFTPSVGGRLGVVWRLRAGAQGQILKLRHVHSDERYGPEIWGHGRHYLGMALSNPKEGLSVILDWEPVLSLSLWPLYEGGIQTSLGLMTSTEAEAGKTVFLRFSISMVGN